MSRWFVLHWLKQNKVARSGSSLFRQQRNKNMNNNFEPLQGDAVVSIDDIKEVAFLSHPTNKVELLQQEIRRQLIDYSRVIGTKDHEAKKKWIDEAIAGEILKPGNQWIKGKIRIKLSIEFQADEPVKQLHRSPLDDIRQSMKE